MKNNERIFKKIWGLALLIFTFSHSFIFAYQHDLSIMGFAIYTEALGRLSITSIDSLKDELKLNFIPVDNIIDPVFIPPKVLKIIYNKNKKYGAVSLMYQYSEKNLKECNSKIKILYTMFDSSAIPPGLGLWYNDHFDAIVVPDEWLVDTYRNAGVTIPIFVLPCPISLKEFLHKPLHKRDLNQPFIFGTSGSFVPRKNHITLLEAFIQEFGQTPDVKLRLHGRWGLEDQALHERIKETGVTNVEIINKTITQDEYISFLTSLDCYAFLSKGEGFSITPREALACGIPCILTNNTAHKTLCNSGLVRSVPSPLLEPSYHCNDCGYFFNCTISEVRQALRDVYTHYEITKRLLPEEIGLVNTIIVN